MTHRPSTATKKLPLAKARNKIRATLRRAGYELWNGGNQPSPTTTMTADLHRRGDGEFVLSCGCDYKLSEADRQALWQANGEILFKELKKDGFKPDPKPYGELGQRKTFIVEIR